MPLIPGIEPFVTRESLLRIQQPWKSGWCVSTGIDIVLAWAWGWKRRHVVNDIFFQLPSSSRPRESKDTPRMLNILVGGRNEEIIRGGISQGVLGTHTKFRSARSTRLQETRLGVYKQISVTGEPDIESILSNKRSNMTLKRSNNSENSLPFV
jgi:hypothetical protein